MLRMWAYSCARQTGASRSLSSARTPTRTRTRARAQTACDTGPAGARAACVHYVDSACAIYPPCARQVRKNLIAHKLRNRKSTVRKPTQSRNAPKNAARTAHRAHHMACHRATVRRAQRRRPCTAPPCADPNACRWALAHRRGVLQGTPVRVQRAQRSATQRIRMRCRAAAAAHASGVPCRTQRR